MSKTATLDIRLVNDAHSGTLPPIAGPGLMPLSDASGSGVIWVPPSGGGGSDLPADPGAGDWVLAWDDVSNLPYWSPRAGFSILGFSSGLGSLVETSQTIVNPTFAASYSASPTTCTLTNSADSESKDVSGTPTAFTSSHSFQKTTPNQSVTFTLTAVRGPTTVPANYTITWGQKNFWGVSSSPATTEAFIEALAGSGLATSASKTFTVAPGAGEYICFAHPTRYGTPTFTVGGFSGGFTSLGTTISVTNAQGFTENYTLWRSDNVNLGSTTVTVS